MYKAVIVVILVVVIVVTYPAGESFGRDSETREDVPFHTIVFSPHSVLGLVLALPPPPCASPPLPALHQRANPSLVVQEAPLVKQTTKLVQCFGKSVKIQSTAVC